MRSGSILLLSLLAIAGGEPSHGVRSPLSPRFHKQGRQETHSEPRKCAHIVIWELSGSDPRIVKQLSKGFRSNMPILPVPPPCLQDSAARKR
jgi:hypothetical protein